MIISCANVHRYCVLQLFTPNCCLFIYTLKTSFYLNKKLKPIMVQGYRITTDKLQWISESDNLILLLNYCMDMHQWMAQSIAWTQFELKLMTQIISLRFTRSWANYISNDWQKDWNYGLSALSREITRTAHRSAQIQIVIVVKITNISETKLWLIPL